MTLTMDARTVPHIALGDSATIPQVGLGVFAVPDEAARDIVKKATQIGYRHIDTAARYGNERGVGRGIAESRWARATSTCF